MRVKRPDTIKNMIPLLSDEAMLRNHVRVVRQEIEGYSLEQAGGGYFLNRGFQCVRVRFCKRDGCDNFRAGLGDVGQNQVVGVRPNGVMCLFCSIHRDNERDVRNVQRARSIRENRNVLKAKSAGMGDNVVDSRAVVLPNHWLTAGDDQRSVAAIIRGGKGRPDLGVSQVILPGVFAGAIKAVQIAQVINNQNEQIWPLASNKNVSIANPAYPRYRLRG